MNNKTVNSIYSQAGRSYQECTPAYWWQRNQVYIIDQKEVCKIFSDFNHYKKFSERQSDISLQSFLPEVHHHWVIENIWRAIFKYIEWEDSSKRLYTLDTPSKTIFFEKVCNLLKKLHSNKQTRKYFDTSKKFESTKNQWSKTELSIQEKLPLIGKLLTNYKPSKEIHTFGHVHGDVHIENIFYSDSTVQLIDWDSYWYQPLRKESRMLVEQALTPSWIVNQELEKHYLDWSLDEILSYCMKKVSYLFQGHENDILIDMIPTIIDKYNRWHTHSDQRAIDMWHRLYDSLFKERVLHIH